MNRAIVALAGFLLIATGTFTALYHTTVAKEESVDNSVLERILEGEEYLKQNNEVSKQKAVSIFSELAGKQLPADLVFRVKFNQAKALERAGERYLALEKLKELKTVTNASPIESEKLAASLGILLLKVGEETEGKGHLEAVLRSSNEPKLRSKVLQSLADFSFRKGEFEVARKNYVLALREDGNNNPARIGWGRTLRKLGKDWAAFDVFDEYLDTEKEMDGIDPKLHSEYRDSVYSDARMAFVKKQYWKSIEYFKKALTLNPSPAIQESALYYIALSYDGLGKKTEALDHLNKVLNNEHYSLDQKKKKKKGTIYFREGEFEKAASVFQTIVEKYPKNHITEKAMAWKRESLDQYKEGEGLEKSSFSEPQIKDAAAGEVQEKPKNELTEWGSDLDF